MEEKTLRYKSPSYIIAGILLLAYAVLAAFLWDLTNIWNLLSIIPTAIAGICLLVGKRNVGFPIMLLILAVPEVYFSFDWLTYTVRSIINYGFDLYYFLISLSYVFSAIAFVMLAVVAFSSLKKPAGSLAILSAVLYLIGEVARFTGVIYVAVRWGGNPFSIYDLLPLILTVAFFLMGSALRGKEDEIAAITEGDGAAHIESTPSDGHIDMVLHVLMLFLLGGIWNYIWIYKTTKYLNNCKGEEYRNPTTKLLLCMFIPFYHLYWTYKSAQRIDKMSAERGLPSDSAALCLILAIFIGIVPPILMQSKINSICEHPVAPVAPVTPAPAAAPAPSASAADEIKKYKELLDMGAITEEEYNAKKKELLGL